MSRMRSKSQGEARRGRHRRLAGALVAATAVVALAGGAASSDAIAFTVKVGRDYGLNRSIVVSGAGRAVYRHSGERAGHVTCTGLCTQKWPPLTVLTSATRLTRGPGVTGILGKFRRADGRWQVTLRGYPLYMYSPDHSPGDARGRGEGGAWWTLAP